MPSAREPEAIYLLFGRRLRELREKKGIPPEELAALSGLSRSSIVNIELGKQRVLLHQLLLFAEALHEDVSALVPMLKTAATAADEKKSAYLNQVRLQFVTREEPGRDDDEEIA